MPTPTFVPAPPFITFRVQLRSGVTLPPDSGPVWREIEFAGNQTVDIFGDAIPLAFGFTDPHLWSFYFGPPGKAGSVEYTSPVAFDHAEPGDSHVINAASVRILLVPFPLPETGNEIDFHFDFGDDWFFCVRMVKSESVRSSGKTLPRIVGREGIPPPQYPAFVFDDG